MEVVRRVTSTPAACIGRVGELGTLVPGAAADVSLLRMVEGEWRLRDSAGAEELGGMLLEPVGAVRGGRYVGSTPSRAWYG